MDIGLLIYAVMIGIQFVLFVTGIVLIIVGLVKLKEASILWACFFLSISNIFPMIGAVCCYVIFQ